MATKKSNKDQIEEDAQEIAGAEELDDTDLDDVAGGRGLGLTIEARNLASEKLFAGAAGFGKDFNTADLRGRFTTVTAPSGIDKLKR